MTHAHFTRDLLRTARMRTAILVPLLVGLVGCAADASDSRADVPRDVYPAGPYGVNEGDVVVDHVFLTVDGGTMSLQDVRADERAQLLLVATAAGWCAACIEEQPSLQALHETHGASGLRVMTAVFQDSELRPATPELAGEWQEGVAFDVVADPELSLGAYYDTALTPMNMIVDAATMEIVRIGVGFDESAIQAIVEARL
jgi:thiol-disulfide isomerase/thioredoxin